MLKKGISDHISLILLIFTPFWVKTSLDDLKIPSFAIFIPNFSTLDGDILAFKRDENLIIPDKINYDGLSGLSNEVKAKFKEIKPKTMGQALRIDGITPAAVYILLSHVKRKSIKHIA